jgi:hypothetical protein
MHTRETAGNICARIYVYPERAVDASCSTCADTVQSKPLSLDIMGYIYHYMMSKVYLSYWNVSHGSVRIIQYVNEFLDMNEILCVRSMPNASSVRLSI